VHLTAKESQATEKTNIKESYNKSCRPHAPNRERERDARAHTQQHKKARRRPIPSILDHRNVSPRCPDDSSGRNSFFSGIILDEWVHIPTNKQAERSDWLTYIQRERDTHTQAHSKIGEWEDDRFRAYSTTRMWVFAVETTVPGGTVLDKYAYIPKQAESSDWFTSIETYKHRRTQQLSRTRRRPIPSIFDHQGVGPRCRDDSSGWNSFFFFFPLQTRNFSGRIYIHIPTSKPKKVTDFTQSPCLFCTLKNKENNSLALPSIIGPAFWMPRVFFCFFFFFFFFSSILWS